MIENSFFDTPLANTPADLTELLSGGLLLAGDSLESAASDELPERLRKLALLYAYGGVLGKNPERAASLLKKSASLGDIQAAFYLAMALREGFGLSVNLAESFAWLRVAAAKNYPEAIYELAYAFQNGLGCTANPVQANKLFERAAKLNFPKAISKMLNASLAKKDPDIKEILYWVRLGKETVPAAMIAAARSLLSQEPPGVEEALTLLEKGASAGDADCLAVLAAFWYEGKYLPANKAVALSLAHMAVTAGNYVAESWLNKWRKELSEEELLSATELASGASLNAIIEELRRLR